MNEKSSPAVSLMLLIPAPSIGVLFGMILLPGSVLGKGIFLCSKLWILLLPAGWYCFVEKARFPRQKTVAGGFRWGWITGLSISAFIAAAYLLLADRLIDPSGIRTMAAETGLARKSVYLTGALYWICINSFLEEYVWRWFVVRQCAKVMSHKTAIAISALGFTLHHIVAMQVYFSWRVTLLAALCIAVGGALWSWMFLRYKTIWPGWLSHALVDITVFGLGYVLIFG